MDIPGAADALRALDHEPGLTQLLLAAGGMLTGSGMLAAALIPKLSHWLQPTRRETRLADYLPFESVLAAGDTIRCRDGTLVRCVELAGLPLTALSSTSRRDHLRRRKTWLDQLAGSGFQVRVFTMRRRAPTVDLDGETHPVRREILRRWDAQFAAGGYTSRHVVVLSIAGAEAKAVERLDAAVGLTMQSLAPYRSRVLGVALSAEKHPDEPDGDVARSDLLQFWAEIINRAARGPVHPARLGLREVLAQSSLEFDPDTGLVIYGVGGGDHAYAYVVGIPMWGEWAAEDLMRQILGIDGELTVMQRVQVMSDGEAELRLKRAADLRLHTSWAQGIADQFDAAREAIQPGARNKQTLVGHEMVIFAEGDTPEDAKLTADAVRRVLQNSQIRSSIQVAVALPLWWSQLPTYDQKIRECLLMSQQVAEWTSFDAAPTGSDRCDWNLGPPPVRGPVLQLRTESLTPYSFVPHEHPTAEALGHMLVIGRSRTGKSTLMLLLAAAALRFPGLRVFIFDRDRGALTWTLAMGNDAAYLALHTAIPGVARASLAPLQLPLTPETEAHIVELLRLMTGLTDAASEAIWEGMLSTLRTLQPEHRRLDILVDASVPKDSEAYAALRPWIGEGPLGGLFGRPGARDHVDLSRRVTVFDMTAVLSDTVAAAPVVADLFYRIRATLAGGTPAFIIVDEAPVMLASPHFRGPFLRTLQEGGKRRQVLAVMMQRPGSLDAIDRSLADAVRSQCPTWLFMRDSGAARSEYDPYEFTDREWAFVRGDVSPGLERAVLLKRPGSKESVVLDFNLRQLGDLAQIFRSGEMHWRRAIELQTRDPQGWLKTYLDWAPT